MSTQAIAHRRRGFAVCALIASGMTASVACGIDHDAHRSSFDDRIRTVGRKRVDPTPKQRTAVDTLRTALPDLRFSFDPALGTTRTLSNGSGYLTAADAVTPPIEIGLRFVEQNIEAFGLAEVDLADYEITDHVYTAVTGATHIYLRQRFEGIPVYNGQLQINVNRDGRLLSINNAFVPRLADAADGLAPGLDLIAAVRSAAEHLGLPNDLPILPVDPTSFLAAGVSTRPIEGLLMLLPVGLGEVRLVWNFQVYTPDSRHMYDLTVDANTGKVWTRFDWVDADDYKVYDRPAESPNHVAPLPPLDGRVVITDPADSSASPLGWHDDGTTLHTTMRGNNVHAYEDRDGNDTPPGTEPDCGALHDCEFPLDLTQEPDDYIPGAVANLFYWNNLIHDVQYQYGFDEIGGNFQVDTFGLGGVGGDDVIAWAQKDADVFERNNAFFGTPPDGSRPQMLMLLWNHTTPERDGDLDNGIVLHEYGHGITNRQVGGPSQVSCLENVQQPGEGWSDWFALVYTAKTGDAGADPRGIGTYVLGEPVSGPGIRPQRYSTDPAVNTYTYETIGSGVSVPHGVGSVWAQVIWEMYWALVDEHGFDPNLYDALGGAGNQRAMLYINEGLENTACSPTFLDARDGIIQAVVDNHGGVDLCLAWQAFADFGLGFDATTGGPNTLTATNGFAIPAACECPLAFAACRDITVELDLTGSATITGDDLDDGSCGFLTLDTTTFTCDDVGPNTVTMTAIDTGGGTDTCTATVNVVLPPVMITCPPDVMVDCGDSIDPTDTGLPTVSGGPAPSYTVVDSNDPGGPIYDFEDITATGTFVSLTDDEVTGATPLLFSFDYFGIDYTNVYISSNGFLTVLANQATGCCTGQPLPQFDTQNGVIAGWWEDLNPGNGGAEINLVHYETLGVAPNRRFIVQFTEVDHWSSGARVTMQFKLFEGSNTIEVHYQDAPSDGGTHSAGIENAAGTAGVQYFFGTSGLTSPLAVRYERVAEATFVDASGGGCPDVITRTWTVGGLTDTCLDFSCVQTITVVDTTALEITCPSDVVVECGDPTDPANTGIATGVSGCGIDTISSSDVTTPGGCAQATVIIRTWTGTDFCGSSVNCDQIITVVDTTAPTLTCPVNATVECGGSTAPADTGMATATDCGLDAITFSDVVTQGGCPLASTITRKWLATDLCGNQSSCDQIVTVLDTTAPTLTCPVDVNVECAGATDPAHTGTATAVDCGLDTIEFSDVVTPGGCPMESTITRTWTATDVCGNASTCDQVITVADTLAPTLTCPPNIMVECGESTLPAETGMATALDCGLGTVTFSDVATPGGCDQVSSIVRTWTATDLCGNVSSCDQTITVVDSTGPVMKCPVQATVECGESTAPAATGAATATDCLLDMITFSDVVIAGACPQESTIIRTWTATDRCGNLNSCDQTINVVDSTAPLITCPVDVTVECEGSTAPDDTGTASATDCGLDTMTFSDAVTLGVCPQAPTIIRTWTATDLCGNVSSCDQTISVVDSEAPMISCPADAAVQCDDSVLPVDTGTATAVDCGLDNVSFSDTVTPGLCPAEETITRTWTATDLCGNTSSCDQTITIVDGSPPTLIDVPGDIAVACGAVPPPANVTAADNCGDVNSVTLTEELIEGACADTYTLTRSWSATDACGNETTAIQIITVVDTTPPMIVVCPADIVVHADAGVCDAMVVWDDAGVTDACDPSPGVVYDIDLGDDGSVDVAGHPWTTFSFPAGNHRVTTIAGDRCGNTDTSCSFVVDVSMLNEVLVDVQLSPTVVNTLARCVTFEFTGPTGTHVIDEIVDFTAGEAAVLSLLVPCGEWTCVSARDPLHTLRSADDDDFAIFGPVYTSDFTDAAGDDDRLIGGDLNDDGVVDILDFGVLNAQFGVMLPPSDCETSEPHSDINGNGVVDASDFTFLAIHFVQTGEAPCAEPTANGAPEAARSAVFAIGVDDLWARGLAYMTPADLNNDGLLDLDDVALFAEGARPDHRVAILREDVEKARWSDRTTWAGGVVPDAMTHVFLEHGVVHVEDDAEASSIEVGPRATLIVEPDKLLDATSVLVKTGGRLRSHGVIRVDDADAIVVEDGGLFSGSGRLDFGGRMIRRTKP